VFYLMAAAFDTIGPLEVLLLLALIGIPIYVAWLVVRVLRREANPS